MSENTGRQLLFAVGDHLFTADARCVREIVEAGLVATPIPGAIPAVWGLINLRGNLLVAGSLGALLELRSRPVDPVLVVFEHRGRQVALEVDRVIDVMAEAHSGASGDHGQLAAHPVVSGVGQLGDRSYFRLDIRQLFARLLEEEEQAGDTEAGQSDGGAG